MKTKHIAAIVLIFLAILVGTIAFAQPPGFELERERGSWCDEMRFKIVIGAEEQMVEMLEHEVDAGWPPRLEDIQTLIEAGYTMAVTGGVPRIWTCCTGPYDGEPGVLGWVNMVGHGGINWHNIWGKLYSRREGADGTPYPYNIWLMGGNPEIINPLTSNTDNEWQLLSLVYSTLLQMHPYTSANMPWCVTDMPIIQSWNGTHREVSPGVWIYDPSPVGSPSVLPVIGEYMRWTLRDDMTWHDGTPVTSADVEFCLDLLVKQNNLKYAAIQTLIHDVNVLNPYTFEIYYTGMGGTVGISSIALLAPRHIWGPYIAGDDGILWTGDDRDHRFWNGHYWTEAYGYSAPIIDTPSGPVQLTHLQGNGPFVYPEGGFVPDEYIRLIRYDWWHFRRILRGDNTFDGIVDVIDMWAPIIAFGSMPGMPQWEFLDAGLKADMANPAALIDGRDISKVYDDWGFRWYPQSTLPP